MTANYHRIKNLAELEALMSKTTDFDFERWMRLYKLNPDLFEQQRQEVLSKFIDDLPPHVSKQRMQGLQWQIDMIRERSSNPLEATMRIYDMMWDSVADNYENMQTLADLIMGKEVALPQKQDKATVLLFENSRVEAE